MSEYAPPIIIDSIDKCHPYCYCTQNLIQRVIILYRQSRGQSGQSGSIVVSRGQSGSVGVSRGLESMDERASAYCPE